MVMSQHVTRGVRWLLDQCRMSADDYSTITVSQPIVTSQEST